MQTDNLKPATPPDSPALGGSEAGVKTLKRFAYNHLGLAHELCARAYLCGAGSVPEMAECIERINSAGRDFDEYMKTGKLPEWMLPNGEVSHGGETKR